MTLFTSVHGAPPLPLHWIFADAKPRSALSRASVFFTDTICPKAPPRARDAALVPRRRLLVDGPASGLAGRRSAYGTNRTRPKTIRQTIARCALKRWGFNACSVLLNIGKCLTFRFLLHRG